MYSDCFKGNAFYFSCKESASHLVFVPVFILTIDIYVRTERRILHLCQVPAAVKKFSFTIGNNATYGSLPENISSVIGTGIFYSFV